MGKCRRDREILKWKYVSRIYFEEKGKRKLNRKIKFGKKVVKQSEIETASDMERKVDREIESVD